eukprot:gene7391-9857_t
MTGISGERRGKKGLAKRHLTVLGSIAALCAFLSSAATAEPGVTDTTIFLGGSNALSGPVAAVCAPASYGAKAWFDKVNRDGGVHGRKIDYNVLDDAFSAQRAVSN